MVSARPRAASLAPIDWQDVELLDGSVMSAQTLRSQPVVVQFWASWCPFCKRQNPVLQQLHETTRDRGLQVLTFTLDIDAQKARDYLRDHRYTFPAALAGAASARWFGARRSGLPDLYVVDVRGQVAFHEADEMFPEDVLALARYAGA
ncbi:MAG TPA: TlpA disulfide reductase family protein, partial [Casimicrobiaceae bacterium]|nr:TlpA disulfide reductase family protein [Casimicrobiaceae bacterium]